MNKQEKKMKLSLGFSMDVPSYCIHDNVIWGATAMILSELREITGEIFAK
jgi:hypothetical protein